MDEAGNPVPGKGYNMVQGMVVLDDEDHKNCTKTLLGFSQSNGEKLREWAAYNLYRNQLQYSLGILPFPSLSRLWYLII